MREILWSLHGTVPWGVRWVSFLIRCVSFGISYMSLGIRWILPPNDMQLIPNDTHLTTNDTHLNKKTPHDQSHPSLCGPEIVNIFSHTLVCITMLLLILPRPIQNVSSHKETLKRAYLIRFFDNYGVAFFSTLTFFRSVKWTTKLHIWRNRHLESFNRTKNGHRTRLQ